MWVRSYTEVKPPPGTKWGEKKDLAAIAEEKRGNPVILEAEGPSPATAPPPVSAPMAVVTLAAVGSAEVASRPAASALLKNDAWREQVELSVKGGKGVSSLTIEQQATLAEAVVKQLDQRLERHINERVAAANRNHFTLKFTRWLIPTVAAIHVLFDHLKTNMSFVSLGGKFIDKCLQLV